MCARAFHTRAILARLLRFIVARQTFGHRLHSTTRLGVSHLRARTRIATFRHHLIALGALQTNGRCRCTHCTTHMLAFLIFGHFASRNSPGAERFRAYLPRLYGERGASLRNGAAATWRYPPLPRLLRASRFERYRRTAFASSRGVPFRTSCIYGGTFTGGALPFDAGTYWRLHLFTTLPIPHAGDISRLGVLQGDVPLTRSRICLIHRAT